MVEMRDDPGEVTDPVAIRVCERARVDLIDDARLPPLERCRGCPVRAQPPVPYWTTPVTTP
jgi:hypothetical protein